jgi:iron complex transport system substrate-binding protein
VGIDRQLRAAGIRVVQLPYAEKLDDVGPNLRQLSQSLGADAAGKKIADDFVARLAALPVQSRAPTALYMTPGNVTAGADTFVGQMITAAGFRPYSVRSGWPSLPLEALQIDRPAMVVRGFFDSKLHKQDAWSISRHAALNAAIAKVPTVDVPGGWVACGNHLSIFAIEKMAQARSAL